MIKRIFLVALLGTFLFGCKVKQKVTYGKRNTETARTTPKKAIPKRTTDDGLYPMPEDTGKFIRMEFEKPKDYIDTFSEVAQREMKAYGIPASITLAQGLLESGFGKGELARKTNNHFGIKCHTGWQGDYDFHDDDEKGECFRKYNHPMYSYRDHSLFLTKRSRYAFLFDYRSTDYKKWAHGLRKAGYATDKRYPQKLISLIEQYGLAKFDKTGAKEIRVASQEVTAEKKVKPKKKNAVYLVREGDTLYSIARRYSVSVNDLKRWNYMYGDTISVGQELTVKTEKFN
ncbi:LysM peptidoglycan-binding domain-containing protein [Maribacter algarum]|uniref:Peptidoglycan hydrolase n=1 Tax=Maribacter algarum (ex Zhang et al. 2020) TaxID=2578118 RepID=A0A5S3PE26_9FLAO|nr:glucosaminidase domain-containing protein [Maribacter algarum]TMM52195.1 LysM peptidoglycan-binding domain-containing protein [Maribacter algarum]